MMMTVDDVRKQGAGAWQEWLIPERVPPGFSVVFDPKDHELILFYVKPKCFGLPLPCDYIREADVYGKDPAALLPFGSNQGFFFTASPETRRVGQKGTWKANKTKPVEHLGETIGFKKALRFVDERSSSSGWVMDEFTLAAPNSSSSTSSRCVRRCGPKQRLQDPQRRPLQQHETWVLCRVRRNPKVNCEIKKRNLQAMMAGLPSRSQFEVEEVRISDANFPAPAKRPASMTASSAVTPIVSVSRVPTMAFHEEPTPTSALTKTDVEPILTQSTTSSYYSELPAVQIPTGAEHHEKSPSRSTPTVCNYDATVASSASPSCPPLEQQQVIVGETAEKDNNDADDWRSLEFPSITMEELEELLKHVPEDVDSFARELEKDLLEMNKVVVVVPQDDDDDDDLASFVRDLENDQLLLDS